MSDLVRSYSATIQAASAHYHIPASTLAAVIFHESRGQQGLTSSAGAKGITQFEPGTAATYHVNTSPGHTHSQIFGAAHYLADLGYASNPTRALASYAAGPGNIGAGMSYASAIFSIARGYRDLDHGSVPVATRAARAAGTRVATASASGSTTTTNIDGAIIDALINHHGGLGHNVLANIASGRYDHATVASTAPARTPATRAATSASAAANPTVAGVTNFDGKPVANWIAKILRYARSNGWSGSVSSGFRSFAEQKRIYDSGVRPAAVPGTSNHEGSQFPRGAVDVTNASQLSAILQRSPYSQQLIWAGGKDPVHFSHPHNGAY